MPIAETTSPPATADIVRPEASPLPPPPGGVARLALFLDMDGVLAPLAPTPDAVLPDARRTEILRRLVDRLEGRVAILSGRTLAEIDRITDTSVIAAAGVHGLQRRGGEGERAKVAHPGLTRAVERFRDFARTRPGVLVEDKGLATALHVRGAPDHAQAAEHLARALAGETGLVLQPGAMVFELKTPGASKGTALAAFMAEAPFNGSTPVMVGDDLTDEDGFRAAAEAGGFGVLVGLYRSTAATHGLADVEAVLAWLDRVEALA